MGVCKMLSLHNHCLLVFLMFFVFCFLSLLTSSAPPAFIPHPDQCHALLQFKSNFVINASASASYYCYESPSLPYPKTESWKENTDCCSSWEGVTCDGESGHVTGLDLSCSQLRGTIRSNSSLFSSHLAPYLRKLNLAGNDFLGSKMSTKFGVKFGSSLTDLNLSDSGFSGNIPSEISHLSNLVSLDLSYNYGLRVDSDRDLEKIAQNLTQLSVLNLNWLNMASVHASSLMNLSSSLTSLRLNDCQLQGQLPASFLLRPNLQEIDLGENDFIFVNTSLRHLNSNNLSLLDLRYTDLSKSIGFLDFVGNHLRSLRHLDLTFCNINVSIPPSLGNLTNLVVLYLGDSHLNGPIPTSFSNLTHLTDLVMSSNELDGPLPSYLFALPSLKEVDLSDNNLHGQIQTPPSLGNLTKVNVLHLQYNHLNGPIPTSFSNMTYLTHLDMSYNELGGPFPSYLFALPSLIKADLSHNMLHGQIPTSPIKSLNLTGLDLSNNNLSGSLDFDVFLTLKKLTKLYLSSNNISSSTSIYTNLTYSLPSLELLDLSGCKLNQFPTFIKALTNLTYLDVSNSQIQGRIPEWIHDVGKDTLSHIDLSGNLLTSVAHQLHWRNIKFVDFHSNLLQGPLPIPPTNIEYFSVSNNNLSGEISSLICNLRQLQHFDLSQNQFTGSIPQCLGSVSDRLLTLNLGKNSLHGLIPNTFAKHNSFSSLVLNGNQLTGTIPQTLSYCHQLQILDVGNNMIEDTVPHWLESLSRLEVLVLRSNKFYGSLNCFKDKLLFPALKILDLSNNNFTGPFPIKLMKNLYAITRVDEMLEDGQQYMSPPNSFYSKVYYTVVITVKGFEMGYVRIMATFTTIDLSGNKLEGHIPEVVGKLISLKGLNLSHNLLTGHIPSSMGDLGSLEWLDLSHNELSGQIPRELTNLDFLQVLDLSSNQLHGAIPQGRHFDTFGNGSYKDNLGLCGLPLTKACGPHRELPSDASQDKSSSDSGGGFSWEGAFVGYGSGVVFGLSIGYLVFKTRSPRRFVKMVEGKQRGRAGKRSNRRARTRN